MDSMSGARKGSSKPLGRRVICAIEAGVEAAYLGTGSPGHKGLARIAHLESGRGLDIIPVLLGEGICVFRQTSVLPILYLAACW